MWMSKKSKKKKKKFKHLLTVAEVILLLETGVLAVLLYDDPMGLVDLVKLFGVDLVSMAKERNDSIGTEVIETLDDISNSEKELDEAATAVVADGSDLTPEDENSTEQNSASEDETENASAENELIIDEGEPAEGGTLWDLLAALEENAEERERVEITEADLSDGDEESEEAEEEVVAAEETATGNLTSVRNHKEFFGRYELPIRGAAGYASVPMAVVNADGSEVSRLQSGESFMIKRNWGGKLEIVTASGVQGYVDTRYVMVNLPDIIPSIVYTDTNSSSSIFHSAGYDLPGITGHQLYEAYFDNERLGRTEYAMPVLVGMAEKVAAAQEMCLEYGYSLQIYETYRPHDVQMAISDSLSELMAENDMVNRMVNATPWSKNWFIAVTLSNHQLGCAMDVSLVKVEEWETDWCGDYPYTRVLRYKECIMPTRMHEVSSAACTFKQPVSSKDKEAWKYADLADSMTYDAIVLQQICTDAGLTPLASEWWHFNDLDAREAATGNWSYGQYRLGKPMNKVIGE